MKEINFFEENGKAPVSEWLLKLTVKARNKCLARIEYLAELGNKTRRPYADYLRDGIYESRIVYSGNQYRILYFFHGTKVIVLAHGFIKKTNAVPKKDMNMALKRMEKYLKDPNKYTSGE